LIGIGGHLAVSPPPVSRSGRTISTFPPVVVTDPDNLSTGLTATISTVSATPSVAEPASAALLVSAILALAALARKRRRDV